MITSFIIVLFVLEIIEISWQKGDTFKSYTQNLHRLYSKNIVLFFALHPTIYFVLALVLQYEIFNFFTLSILLLKVFDMVFKISLMSGIDNKEKNTVWMELLQQDVPLAKGLKYFGLVLYPTLFYFGIT